MVIGNYWPAQMHIYESAIVNGALIQLMAVSFGIVESNTPTSTRGVHDDHGVDKPMTVELWALRINEVRKRIMNREPVGWGLVGWFRLSAFLSAQRLTRLQQTPPNERFWGSEFGRVKMHVLGITISCYRVEKRMGYLLTTLRSEKSEDWIWTRYSLNKNPKVGWFRYVT